MPDGGRLTIETAAVELFDALRKPGPVSIKPGRYMLLAVTDTGVGMDPDVRARVFEPFFTTKEQGKGTGLGLSTVYGIVKQLGGYVWVYSEPLMGSTFKLYFPAAPVLTAVASAESRRDAPEMGSEVVLLVEDEEGLREFASNMLRRHGYQVIEAATGEEGLAAAGRTPHIDLVLTDVVMPGMSGPEMVSRLRRLGPVRAMFMSGYAERALREGIQLQQSRFLEKPFGPTELLRHVRQALDARPEEVGADTAVVT